METLVLLLPSILSVFIYYHYDPNKRSIVYFFYYGIFCLLNNLLYFGVLYVLKGSEFVLDYAAMNMPMRLKYFAFAIAIAFAPAYLLTILKKYLRLKVEYKDEDR